MIDTSPSKFENQCEKIINEFLEFKKQIAEKIELVKQSKLEVLLELENKKNKLKDERRMLEEEKEAWEKEKQRMNQINPIEPIVKLNVGGKEDFHVRTSTLCQVQGSALEAMFSGRHTLQKMEEKIFIDRNPFAFGLLIDFIRNNGELHE